MEILSRTVLAAVVTAIGCSGGAGDPAIEDAEKRPNVIVVLVDALRSDRLGAYGFGERTLITPEGLKILLGHGEPRLYDLDVDPGETQNLATRRPEDFARLKTILDKRFRRALELRDLFAPASPAELTPEQIEALKALGYLGD